MKQARPFVTLRGVASGGGTYDEREKIERGRPERRRPPGAAKQALDYDQALQRWCFIAHLPCIAATSQLFRPTARYLEPGDQGPILLSIHAWQWPSLNRITAKSARAGVKAAAPARQLRDQPFHCQLPI